MTEIELAWAAGFFDGEGSVCVDAPRHGYKLNLSVSQVDLRPLLELQRLFGGSIAPAHQRTERHAKTYQWRVAARLAALALKGMLPYLRVKREVAEVGVAFQAIKHRRPGGQRLNGAELGERKWYAEAVKSLNAKGVEKGDVELPARLQSPQLRMMR